MAEPVDPWRTEPALQRIEKGTLYLFRDWPNPAVPAVAAGVYSVWQGRRLIYVGMAGRYLSGSDLKRYGADMNATRGLATRLASHVAGRRSGDQFCVYIADRLVLPTLTAADIDAVAAGKLAMDLKIREFICRELSYRFAVLEDGREALSLARWARAGALRCGVPLLNPFPGPRRPTKRAELQPTLVSVVTECTS